MRIASLLFSVLCACVRTAAAQATSVLPMPSDTLTALYHPCYNSFFVRAIGNEGQWPDTLPLCSGARLCIAGRREAAAHLTDAAVADYAIELPDGLAQGAYLARGQDTLVKDGTVVLLRDRPGELTLGGLPTGRVSAARLSVSSGVRVRVAGFDCSATYPVQRSTVVHIRNGALVGQYSTPTFRFRDPLLRGDVVVVKDVHYQTALGDRVIAAVRYEVE